MKVLLTVEQTPEETMYAIVDMTKQQWQELKPGHGYMINVNDDDENSSNAVLKILDALAQDPEHCTFEEWACIWKDHVFRMEKGSVDLSDVKRMIMCGIYL